MPKPVPRTVGWKSVRCPGLIQMSRHRRKSAMTTEAIQRMSPEQQLEQMRHRGLDRTHPVRFRYLQALERRLRERGLERSEHWRRLEQKLREFQDVCSDAESPDAPPLAPPKPLSALAELSKALDSQGPPPVPQPSSPLFELLKQN
ncbi:MAG: DUF2894 domain-containing protein, partial [Gammaproteobacteria bacterium]